jgi:2-dehydro-3-deoxygluconokinase
MIDVVTAGETMTCFSPYQAARFADTALAARSFGGAESNTAIGLARLGVPVAWFSRLGADEFGDEIETTLRAEGVDVTAVVRDPERATGVMFKQRPTRYESKVAYYRSTSAATRLDPSDVRDLPIQTARVLHLTGITSAIGPGPREFVREAVMLARRSGVLVTFDPNYRPALWPGEDARDEYRFLLGYVDHLLCNQAEALLITGETEAGPAVRALHELGPHSVVIKRGAAGAAASVRVAIGDSESHEAPAWAVEAVDSVGAGDAFNAGWIFGYLTGLDFVERLRVATWTAAQVVAHPGDYEGAPTSKQHAAAFGAHDESETT